MAFLFAILPLALSPAIARADLPLTGANEGSAPKLKTAPLPSPSPTESSSPVAAQGPVVTLADGARLSLSGGDFPEGGVVVIRRAFPEKSQPPIPTARFEGTEIPFYVEGRAYVALFGVPHGHKPGQAQLEVEIDKDAKQVLSFNVHDGGFPHETLKVDAKLVNPPKKAMIRIRKEQSEIGRIYRNLIPEKLWQGAWIKPIDSAMTSPYGTRRLYNGEERNYHGGLDLKAAIGTPIHAAAAGKVVLAKDLYFTGNTVMVDHGFGLISLYAHMSKLKVKEGQKVSQGDLLGLSGKTGRVNGPHLHWQIILHKTKVNPVELMKAVATDQG